MRILVVGGGGFLGAEIVKKLIECGFDVKSFSRNMSSKLLCEHFVADIQNPDSYKKILSSWLPEVVIQAAWVTDQKIYRTSSLNSSYMNATLKLAELSYSSGTRHFITLGTSAEYGIPTEPCNSLSTRVSPVDIYGRFKLQTLDKLKQISNKFSGRLSWARIFQAYGRNQDSARLIPFATRELMSGRSLKVANPDKVLDWISSRDIASALIYAIKRPLNQIFDIGTAKPISVIETLQTLANLLNVDSQLLKIERNIFSAEEKYSVVVSKESPLFREKWSPQDDLISGLNWTLSK